MKLNDLIFWLEGRVKSKPKTNLDKIKTALEELNNPQDQYKTIHVTGTNGKGSTCKYISNILKQDYKVGLFTSPYIIKFNERIQINNIPINDTDLEKYILWVKDFDQKYYEKHKEDFSFFELVTLIAFMYFKDQKVDYAIIEVGIGGLLDVTNVIYSEVAIITSVGFDHEEQLGHTIKEILNQKLGILKKGGTLITSLTKHKFQIDSYVETKKAKVIYVDNSDYKLIKQVPLEIMYKNNIFISNLVGLYQINNLMLAIEAVKLLLPDLPITTIKKGILMTKNPGRFEVVLKAPDVILDGAHNSEAIVKLIESVKIIYPNKRVHVLYATMSDKPYLKILELLDTFLPNITLTALGLPRALKNFEMFNNKYIIDPVPLEAFKDLLNKAGVDDVILVTGSMYLVSEIRKSLNLKENEF